MRLQLVDHASLNVKVYCMGCGKIVNINAVDIRDRVWADLDGKPFEAYYCFDCKLVAEKGETYKGR